MRNSGVNNNFKADSMRGNSIIENVGSGVKKPFDTLPTLEHDNQSQGVNRNSNKIMNDEAVR
jgi:hypothetical protein